MTELYLRKEGGEWTRVWFDAGDGGFKLTSENPYFTQSETYTLEVSLPMSLLENRMVFGNMQRMDCSKSRLSMECRLIVDKTPVLFGRAEVVQVTDQGVKVQLLGGTSEIKFLSDRDGTYIDEMDLGELSMVADGYSEGGRELYKYSASSNVRIQMTPVFDETRGRHSGGLAPQLCLVDVLAHVISQFGFEVTENCLDASPWNCIYVASALRTRVLRETLPHWKAHEFIRECCNFFNVKVAVDQARRTVRIVSNTGMPGWERIVIEPVDEYSSEMSETEAHGLANDRLSFSLSDSEHHDYDCLEDDVRSVLSRKSFASRNEALQAWRGMDEELRRKYVFATPEGKYASWLHDFSDAGAEEPVEQFTRIDMFAPLEREHASGETVLKIVPAAMADFCVDTEHGGASWRTWYLMPAVSNPLPDKDWRFGGQAGGSTGSEEIPEATVQEYIEGAAEVKTGEQKEDRLQVMFVDDTSQVYFLQHDLTRDTWSEGEGSVGFTDSQYKRPHRGSGHRPWSLSLNNTDAECYLGQLHQNGFHFDLKARHVFRFLATGMPDPNRIFVVRGKLYGCEKIEASVTEKGFSHLMTGYFFEML